MNNDDCKKLSNVVKNNLVFSALESCGTHVFLAVLSPIPESNDTKFLSCKNLLPLGGLVYDTQSDSYAINCFDYISLGTVPISFIASIKDCPNWSTNTPLPEKIIKKYLNAKQKNEMKKFVSKFDKEFSFFYVQMLDPNL